jgi:molybdopterin converting factor small subunit
MLSGPLAAAGMLAGAWGGSHLAAHRAANSSSVVAAGAVGGAPADGLSPATITVSVQLSAPLQALVHERAIDLAVPPGASVGTLLNRLSEDYPVLAAMGPSIMVAVSGTMAPPDTALAGGELVDLMSAMAGG